MKTKYLLPAFVLLITACGFGRRQATPTAVIATPESTTPPTAAPPTPTAPITESATPEPAPTAVSFDFDTEADFLELRQAFLAHTGQTRLDVTYCTVDGVELKMDVYSPIGAEAPTPLIIFIHGGGWSEGDKRGGEYLFSGPVLLDLGYTIASLNYRMAPAYKFPAMIEDVKCAVRSLRAHANDYGIDPERVGVWGSSAGSHLAILLATSDASAGFDVGQYLEQSSRVQAVVDMFGPADLTVDFSQTFVDLKDSVFGGVDLAHASPVTHVSSDDPPFLILHGDLDRVAPLSQSQALYDRLVAAGVEAQLVVVQGGYHGFHLNPNQTPSQSELAVMLIEFYEAHLK